MLAFIWVKNIIIIIIIIIVIIIIQIKILIKNRLSKMSLKQTTLVQLCVLTALLSVEC